MIGSRRDSASYFLARGGWLLFDQQLQLQIAQRFAGRSQKSDTLLAQPLQQLLNHGIFLLDGQLRPVQFAAEVRSAISNVAMRPCGSAAAIKEAQF